MKAKTLNSDPAQLRLDLVSSTLAHIERRGRVEFGPRGLEFAPDITPRELTDIGHRLIAIRGYLKWALGSLFAEMIRRRNECRGRKDMPGETWAAQFAEAHKIDSKEFREVIGVCVFYANAEPFPSLSYEHHREAMWGVDDGQPRQLERAVAYLQEGARNGWGVGQLRRHMRSAGATEPVEPQQMDLGEYGVVHEAGRWARHQLDALGSYSAERAALVLDDLEPVIQLVDRLRALAKQQA